MQKFLDIVWAYSSQVSDTGSPEPPVRKSNNYIPALKEDNISSRILKELQNKHHQYSLLYLKNHLKLDKHHTIGNMPMLHQSSKKGINTKL